MVHRSLEIKTCEQRLGVVVEKQTTLLWRILIQILGFRCPVRILKTNRILIFSLRGAGGWSKFRLSPFTRSRIVMMCYCICIGLVVILSAIGLIINAFDLVQMYK